MKEKIKKDFINWDWFIPKAITISFIAFIILIPLTHDKNLEAKVCRNTCQDKACELTMGKGWCYEWESMYSRYLSGHSCSGEGFLSKESCIRDCLNHCPSKMSWIYVIITGIPIWIIVIVMLIAAIDSIFFNKNKINFDV